MDFSRNQIIALGLVLVAALVLAHLQPKTSLADIGAMLALVVTAIARLKE